MELVGYGHLTHHRGRARSRAGKISSRKAGLGLGVMCKGAQGNKSGVDIVNTCKTGLGLGIYS